MIRCPKCSYKFDYREAVMDDDWRGIIGLLPVFGAHGKLVFEYVEKVGIKPLSIKSSKVLRLLRQMGKLFESGSFEWRKGNKSISKSGILEALEIVVNKNFDVPLENHNYLKKVMVGISEREGKEKSIQDEKDLRKKERLITENGKRKTDNGHPMTTGEFRERIGKLAGQMKGIDSFTAEDAENAED